MLICLLQMMKHAWDNYVRYAWGKNELRPITKRGHSASIFGSMSLGATIVDGLDTLYIMGLEEEFKQGRDWIAENFDINSAVSSFITNVNFATMSVQSCCSVRNNKELLHISYRL
jgi:mannosyl-oligosaccharide alpha-1,2-mannosidase